MKVNLDSLCFHSWQPHHLTTKAGVHLHHDTVTQLWLDKSGNWSSAVSIYIWAGGGGMGGEDRGGGKLRTDFTSQQYRQLHRQIPPPPPALLVLPDYLTGATGSGWHGFMGFVRCALLNYGWEKWHCDSCSSQGVGEREREAKRETETVCKE